MKEQSTDEGVKTIVKSNSNEEKRITTTVRICPPLTKKFLRGYAHLVERMLKRVNDGLEEKVYVGTAICGPKDTFTQTAGEEFARPRALLKQLDNRNEVLKVLNKDIKEIQRFIKANIQKTQVTRSAIKTLIQKRKLH